MQCIFEMQRRREMLSRRNTLLYYIDMFRKLALVEAIKKRLQYSLITYVLRYI